MSTKRPTALVVGGTGPTGPHVVNGLGEAGYDVTILHTGRHESPDIGPDVRHIHTNPFDAAETATALKTDTFDLAILMYGRVRDLVDVLVGKAAKLMTIGGFPVYAGWGDADAFSPAGMRAPTREDAPLAGEPPTSDALAAQLTDARVNAKVAQIAVTERKIFEAHPTATHFRYPWIYGPNQTSPREWLVVRRVLDGRKRIVVPDSGLSLQSMAHVENAAAMVLAAVRASDAADGETYNVSDEWTPTVTQWIEMLADALGHSFECISIPWELATPSQHLTQRSTPHHRLVGCDKAMFQLGYRDVVGVSDGLTATARWLAEHPVERGGATELAIGGTFDYEAEDRLIDAWLAATKPLVEVAQTASPGYIDRYTAAFDDRPEAKAGWRSVQPSP